MTAGDTPKSGEGSCVECGARINGGRYCDACLPPNQTELEEQYDREHPIGTETSPDPDSVQNRRQDAVTCPECNREIRRKNEEEKIRRALYNHLYRLHSGSLSTREMLDILDKLAPSDSPELPDDAAWEQSLADPGISIKRDTEEIAAEAKDEPVKPPSSDKHESMRKVADAMRSQGSSMTVKQLKRMIRHECPGRQPGRLISMMLSSGMIEQDPAFGYKCYRVAAADPAHHAAQVAADASRHAIVSCPVAGCSWSSTSGDLSRLKHRLYDHLTKSEPHKDLPRDERVGLVSRQLPGVPWPVSHGTKKSESRSTPDIVHRASSRASQDPAPEAVRTVLLLDGTNGFSFVGCGAFLERTMKPFLENRTLRVEIVDTGRSLRMTMEMQKEEKE